MAEKTFVFDAEGMILGRLASATADILLKAAREDRDDKVIIVNAEKAISCSNKCEIGAIFAGFWLMCASVL